MRKSIKSSRQALKQDRPGDYRRDELVATVWLVFYGLAIGVAISAPYVSHALEIAWK